MCPSRKGRPARLVADPEATAEAEAESLVADWETAAAPEEPLEARAAEDRRRARNSSLAWSAGLLMVAGVRWGLGFVVRWKEGKAAT